MNIAFIINNFICFRKMYVSVINTGNQFGNWFRPEQNRRDTEVTRAAGILYSGGRGLRKNGKVQIPTEVAGKR